MKVSSVNNISFGANLFYQGRQVNSGMLDCVDISTYGAGDTDIFVSKIESENDGADINYPYSNKISFSLCSPLFGNCTFNNVPTGRTEENPNYSNIEADTLLYNFFTSENCIKNLEDAALRRTLLKKINEGAFCNKYPEYSVLKNRDIDATDILLKRLDRINYEVSHITPQRIEELYGIAHSVNNDVALVGARTLLGKLDRNV